MCVRVCSQPSSRCATPGLSAATLASLGGTSSRRGSADTGSIYDPDTSLSELRVRCIQSCHSINMADSSVLGGGKVLEFDPSVRRSQKLRH